MDQHYVAGQAGRCGDLLLVEIEDVAGLCGIHAFHVLRIAQLVIVFDDGIAAVGLGRGLGGLAQHVAAAVAVGVIPVHLDTALRNREGVVADVSEVAQAIAGIGQLGGHCALLGDGIDVIRRRGCALALVHRNLVAVRIALEHRQLAGGQLVLVLLCVGCSDDEQRFFVLERIAEEAPVIDRRGAGFETAGPGRDAAVGVAFLLGSEWRQGGAELVCFLGGDSGHNAGGQQRQGQCAGAQHRDGVHACVPLPVLRQKFRPKLTAT
ncbi:hypothetical protein FQZ97_801930 [compost metagenome]